MSGRSAGDTGRGRAPAPDLLGAAEDAAESVGTTLDERTTCAELAGFACRQACDAAQVDLLPADVPVAGRPPGTPLTTAAVAGRTPLLAIPPGSRSPSVQALDAGHPITSADAGLAGHRPRRVVSLPLVAHGRLFGVLLGVRAGDAFSHRETAVLHYAARLAAVHLGHAREHTAAQSTVLDLQRALLTEPGRPHPNLEVAARYLPAGGGTLVGGDWFETVRLHFGRTLLAVGDVMGHGLEAAVDMNAYRSALRYVASTDLPPHRVLRQLDSAVADESGRRPATCLLVRFDPARSRAALASAGHLPPVLFGEGGDGSLLDLPVSPPLGTGLGGYEMTTWPLAPQQTLVMFTDGLVERRGEDIDVSLARLAGLRLPPDAHVDALLERILDRLDAEHAEDDVAVVAARIRSRPHPAAGAAG